MSKNLESPYPELQYLWDYIPEELRQNSVFRLPKLVAPPLFYEKHLDERLVLKHVVLLPSLAKNLSDAVDRVLESLKDGNVHLPPIEPGVRIPQRNWHGSSLYTTPTTDPLSVTAAYQQRAALFCGLAASMLFLTPHAPRWKTALIWGAMARTLDDYKGIEERFGLSLRDPIPDDLCDLMDQDTLNNIRHTFEKSPNLAIWEVFPICPEAEAVLKNMEEEARAPQFSHSTCSPLGFSPVDAGLPFAPDATTTAWGSSTSSFFHITPNPDTSAPPGSLVSGPLWAAEAPLRRSLRTHKKRDSDDRQTGRTKARKTLDKGSEGDTSAGKQGVRWVKATLPGQSAKPSSITEPIISHVLQRAWARSVHMGSTFIVFHCGKYERIGFRNRETRTLYLSELIDVYQGKDPAYGKLHTGLYVSILHDSFERIAKHMEHDRNKKPRGRKRRHGYEVSSHPSKRPRTRAQEKREREVEKEYQTIIEHLTSDITMRDILFIRMQFECYNSPAPAPFLRSGRPRPGVNATYTPDEYILLTLAPYIDSGATGVIHGATLEYSQPSKKTRTIDVVVKLAFGDQQQKLRHEHSIYQHLTSSGVTDGVPVTLGLFEDMESDTLALIMTHVGTALVTIYADTSEYVVPKSQRSAFIRAMKSIHNAGVRHRDIRPENLMVNDSGKVSIIDFDMAELWPTDGAKKRELAHLEGLLDGDYYPPNESPSEPITNGGSGSSASSNSNAL